VTSLMYGLLVNFLVLGVILGVFRVTPSWGALLLPLMLVPVMILGVGIGLALAVTGAVVRDLTNVVTTLLGLIMYLTPAVYAPSVQNRWLQAAITYNPLTYLVDEPRNVFFRGTLEHPLAFGLAVLFSVLILCAGVHAFYLIEDHVAERL
jgi:lipopolysaccharide transport system permease protein